MASSTATDFVSYNAAEECLRVGTPVWVRRRGQPHLEGEVAYLGPVKFSADKDWVGVRLKGSSIEQGKNGGTVDGISYFETSSPHQGLFVRQSSVKVRFTKDGPMAAASPTSEDGYFNGGGGEEEDGDAAGGATPPRIQNMVRTPTAMPKATAKQTPPSLDRTPASQQAINRTPGGDVAAVPSPSVFKFQEQKQKHLEKFKKQQPHRHPTPTTVAKAAAAEKEKLRLDPDQLAQFAESLSPKRKQIESPATTTTPNSRRSPLAASRQRVTPTPKTMMTTRQPHPLEATVTPTSLSSLLPTEHGPSISRSISLDAQGYTTLRGEPGLHGRPQHQDRYRNGTNEHVATASWCQAFWTVILLLGSFGPPVLLAISFLVPNMPTILPHDKDETTYVLFLTRFVAGLLLGQLGTSLLLLLPLLSSTLFCFCCSCSWWTSQSTFVWNAARISGLLNAWMGLLLVVVTLSLSTSDFDHNKPLLLGGAAGTLVLATLGLALSYWPGTVSSSSSSPNSRRRHRRRRRGPRMFQRNQYPVLNTVLAAQETQDGLLEPLLLPTGTGNNETDRGHPDDVEAGMADSFTEAVEPTVTGRVRGTRRLLQLASSQVLYLYLGCLALLVRLPFSLAIPHFVSTTLAALGHGDYHQARLEILYLFVLGSIDAALDFWCIFLFGYANLRIVKGVRMDLFQRLLRMEVAFFDETNTGTLSSRLGSDCSEMAGDLTWFFRFSIESVVRITGITSYMLIRSPRLGACALGIVPVVGIINKFYGDWLAKNAIAVQDALAEANAVAQEALSNIRTVIAFAAEDLEEAHYRAKIEKQYKLNVQQLFMQGVYYMAISTFLINTCLQAALLYLGAFMIERDRLTADILLAFMLYQGQLQQETLNLFQSFSSLIKSSGAGDKVFSLLDRPLPPPAIGSNQMATVTTEGEDDIEPLSYDLSLQHVTFSYPSRPAQRVLDDMVLDIPKGSTVALVGPSGCGKTTVVNLLQRFYDPTSGAIMLNGRDLRSYDLHKHRRRIGVVSQDCVLFDGSVLDNITYGSHRRGEAVDDSVTLRDARRAATLAHANAFIEAMPQGYHTIVGERGVQLSGGQRQRISIARAIYQRPLLLILDEATSALDRESEQVVQAALDDLLKKTSDHKPASDSSSAASKTSAVTTTIVIAHRLHTVENADYIAVISEGRVAEFGVPSALMRRQRSLYRQLVERAQQTGRITDS